MSADYGLPKFDSPTGWLNRVNTTAPIWSPVLVDNHTAIQSPFNMQAILLADPKLLAHWKDRPFMLALRDGDLVVRYVKV